LAGFQVITYGRFWVITEGKAAQDASLDASRIRLEYLDGGPVTEEHRSKLKPMEGIVGKIVVPEDYAFNAAFVAALDRRNEELEQTRFNAAHSFTEELFRRVKASKREPER
jgi:hypothetical protein